MSKARILVAEDDNDIRDLIVLHLSREGHSIEATGNGVEALKKLQDGQFQLAILDWMLPDLSGLEITREIRKSKDHNELGVVMVTAKGNNSDVVMGLEAGADDYLVKPFELSVLMARARAVLRRTEKTQEQKLTIAGLEIDEQSHEARCNGDLISLTPYEFKLILTLAQNKGRVLTREQLISEVQGEGVAVVERAIDTHVFGLRKKLGACSDVIETVRGVGYRITGKN